MKKILFVITVVSVMLAACGSAATTAAPQPTLPAPAVNTQAATTVAVAPNPNAPTAVAAAPTAAPKKISLEFTPTDPKSVKLAAGKVQFVEFFAFW